MEIENLFEMLFREFKLPYRIQSYDLINSEGADYWICTLDGKEIIGYVRAKNQPDGQLEFRGHNSPIGWCPYSMHSKMGLYCLGVELRLEDTVRTPRSMIHEFYQMIQAWSILGRAIPKCVFHHYVLKDKYITCGWKHCWVCQNDG